VSGAAGERRDVDDQRRPSRNVAQVLFEWRRLIYRVVVIGIVASVGVSLVLPRWYSASSTFLPPRESEAGKGVAQLSTLLGLDIGGMGLTSSTPSTDRMIGVLKSRRLREKLVDQFGLEKEYRARSREHAIQKLQHHITASTTAEGLIKVEVEDRDKARAADMANALVDLLDDYNRETSVEQALRTSEFIDRSLKENDARLETASDALKAFQEQHGAVELIEQTRAAVEAAADIQAERAKLEIQRGVLSDYAGPNAPQVLELEARIREIDSRLGQIMGSEPGPYGAGSDRADGVLLPLSAVPALGIELARLTRDVLVLDKMHSYLAAQLEESRIQEAKDLRTVQVVDRAVPPLRKSRPRRSLIVVLTTALAAILGSGLALVADGVLESEGALLDARGRGESSEITTLLRWARRLAHWSRAR
jgi:tyrosine-protein kinase Etk/Wzc